MVNFIKKLLGIKANQDTAEKSSNSAKNRLEFLLIQDRAGLNADELAQFRIELLEVIEKYFDVDKQCLDIAYRRETEMTTLQIVSPVLTRKRKASKMGTEKISEKKVSAAT